MDVDSLKEGLRNGMLYVLAWVAWVACLRGWCASAGDMGSVLPWVAWMSCLRGKRVSVGGVLTWVTWLTW